MVKSPWFFENKLTMNLSHQDYDANILAEWPWKWQKWQVSLFWREALSIHESTDTLQQFQPGFKRGFLGRELVGFLSFPWESIRE